MMISSLLDTYVLKDSKEIYFVIFGPLHDFLLIFKIWEQFRYLKQLKNKRRRTNSAWAQFGPRACTVGSACYRKWPMGPMPLARVGTVITAWAPTVCCVTGPARPFLVLG
jgi:hypothetical protein